MEITTALIKELREKTGAGILDCKSALTEANGNMEEAEKTLRKKGLAAAAKTATEASAWLIEPRKGSSATSATARRPPWSS